MQANNIIEDMRSKSEILPYPLRTIIERLALRSGAKPLDLLIRELSLLKPSRELVEEWVRFDDDVYTRNIVYVDDDFEILILNWKSGQRSPIHNHKGSACAVYVVEGVATEVAFARGDNGILYPTNTEHFRAGTTCGSFDEEIHQIVNVQPVGEELISMHIYSPPLHGMEVFPLAQSIFADYEALTNRSSDKARV